MDIIFRQLINRFEGIKSLVTTYQLFEPSILSSVFHLYIEVEVKKFYDKFADDGFPVFPSQILSIKTSFREKIAHLESSKEMASFLLQKMYCLQYLILTFLQHT